MAHIIHYDGQLKEEANLKDMFNEVAEACEVFDWHFEIFENELPKDFREKFYYRDKTFGMAFTPDYCETVWLCFDPYGKLTNPLWKMADDGTYDGLRGLTTTSVDTQNAGIETHNQIVSLLNHLNKKYFSEFKIVDENNFSEAEAGEEFIEMAKVRNKAIKTIEERFGLRKDEDERLEDFTYRIHEIIRAVHLM